MTPYDLRYTPNSKGSLHSLLNETANCGMGAIAQIKGDANYNVLDYALCSVGNMQHRGAIDADGKSGDGSGVLCQLPISLFKRELDKMGQTLSRDEDLAVGVFFLPYDSPEKAQQICEFAEATLKKRNLRLLGWREVPVNPDELGKTAQLTQPVIKHLLVENTAGVDGDAYERLLFLVRRELEIEFPDVNGFYIPTLSSRLIGYKALAKSSALRSFYSDLQDSDFKTKIALYHQRFSTNTFPAWPLGQPFRMMCHNGEINTVKGNRNWFSSREQFFESELWGSDIKYLKELLSVEESDSASLDHALEALVLSGFSLEHAMSILVRPAYKYKKDYSDHVRAFYDYTSCFSEPWDGPAGLVYTDGRKIVASLDRNGLRPSRFAVTDSGLLYIGSESGAVELPSNSIIRRGRLGPGQMLSADTETGELLEDKQIKERLAAKQPYHKWVEDHKVRLKDYVSNEPINPAWSYSDIELSQQQVTHAVTKEDVDMVFPPMIKSGQEAVFSMGDDIPLAVLSTFPRLLYTYFRQLFAQVTNPPIDPIREWTVMTLEAGLGVEKNLLVETPEHAKILQLESAILFEHELETIKQNETEPSSRFPSVIVDATWPIEEGAEGLKSAVERIAQEAETAIDEGATIIVISDKATSAQRVPIPSLLSVGTVHHRLVKAKKRLKASIVVETGDARDTHHIATLFGYGATAVCPYLGYATVRQIVSQDKKGKLGEGMSAEKAMGNYRKALEKGLLKIMSKMGVTVLNSYQGAQLFEAVGIGADVIEGSFKGTHSRIGGIGYTHIAEESLIRHRTAFSEELTAPLDLGDPGYNRYRKGQERHSLPTEVIKNFHTFVKSGAKEDYEGYVKAQLEVNPVAIKDVLEFVPKASGKVPLEEVEPAEDIMRRFTTAAMSLGALSPEAHETLAIAMNRIGAKSDSGEGGEDARRFQPYPNGDNARSAIKQIASGRFGVTAHYLVNADELEIKMAQGAKPGEGGQLPGHKVNSLIARLRGTQEGVQLISPPPHHDIYSIEDLAQLIHDLKEVNPRAKVTVKLVSKAGVGTIAAGVAKANADNILISGHDGGTAASPLSSLKYAGLPWELGIAEAQQALVLNKLRGRVTLRTDGGLRNGKDIVVAALLGAEQYNFGTIAMIAMGCVYVRKCHLNNCPVGIATTDPKWRAKFKGTPEHVVNFMTGVANEVREIMASLGVRKLDEIIGRPEFLKQRSVAEHPKANTLDLGSILADVVPEVAKTHGLPIESIARTCQQERNDGLDKPALDLQILKDIAKATDAPEDAPLTTLMDRPPVSLTYNVVNTDRNLGTRLSGGLAKLLDGNHVLPQGSINLTFNGTAGQSLGTFLVQGVNIKVVGEGNDYVGKGMSGGHITIVPTQGHAFKAEENSIVGNTCLYGATGGTVNINGRAGERFGVRNSGAVAVVEGVGDHGCEYMTNGVITILGRTGRNFGAGMSGGTAFVYDIDGRFQSRINSEMVVPLQIRRPEQITFVKEQIEKHFELTGSARAKEILDDWDAAVKRIVRVIPKQKHELELAEEEHENAGQVETV